MFRKENKNSFLSITSFLYIGNAVYIYNLYKNYKKNPNLVDVEWRKFFDYLPKGIYDFTLNIEKNKNDNIQNNQEINFDKTKDYLCSLSMIHDYRTRGHLYANLDPLKLNGTNNINNEFNPLKYGFQKKDYKRNIFINNQLGMNYITIPKMVNILNNIYCSTIGIEFMHISDNIQKSWIQDRIEILNKELICTKENKKFILNKLIEAEGFEQFLDIKYKGAKRFGLDGAESLIPALEQIINVSNSIGIKEIVFGMSHRGRLNVLSQVMSKSHKEIFYEFKGEYYNKNAISGDVKYHLGISSNRYIDGNNIHLSLLPNPSHLEIINPVVMGKVRAKQDYISGIRKNVNYISLKERSKILPVLIHGDAAFSGQGVVSEMFGLSGLNGYNVAGSIHIIINNQIGFTTNPKDLRSYNYSSDISKIIEALIFHVNGDDPEAIFYVSKIATEFRQTFHKPVIIDIFCYRRFGHNEVDEPAFTQPIMYQKIKKHKTTLSIYIDKLIEEKLITMKEVKNCKKLWKEKLENEFQKVEKNYKLKSNNNINGIWKRFSYDKIQDEEDSILTGVNIDILKYIGRKISNIPENFNIHKKVYRFLENRKKIIENGNYIDWSTAESLAFGSLIIEGNPVRLSGQDVERGTFSQRHSVIYDQINEKKYIPLNHIKKDQENFYEVINSMLSEEAILAFEYGYSLENPNILVLWEAQFGDFANGAQVIFDQFISSAEYKWLKMSGIVCLLPHGFEGQGPEHSSARIERYLQLCAENNIQVANCSTPANYFHILRRQIKRNFRKPLILITPKSLLRHNLAVSDISLFNTGSFFNKVLLDDLEFVKKENYSLIEDKKIIRVIICSGKVYYDLYEKRQKNNINNIYILRIEQLYPFPKKDIFKILSRFLYSEIVWCQEEPKNMGAWTFIYPYINNVLYKIKNKFKYIKYIGRKKSASPATGSISKHFEQVNKFINEALFF